MGIQVECPNGHVFRVKDKYSGVKGLCPHCEGQVVVQVRDVLLATETNQAYRQAIVNQHRAEHPVAGSDSSVFDHPQEELSDTKKGLLGSSVIRHRVKCSRCGEAIPMWFAKCPSCGDFLKH